MRLITTWFHAIFRHLPIKPDIKAGDLFGILELNNHSDAASLDVANLALVVKLFQTLIAAHNSETSMRTSDTGINVYVISISQTFKIDLIWLRRLI